METLSCCLTHSRGGVHDFREHICRILHSCQTRFWKVHQINKILLHPTKVAHCPALVLRSELWSSHWQLLHFNLTLWAESSAPPHSSIGYLRRPVPSQRGLAGHVRHSGTASTSVSSLVTQLQTVHHVYLRIELLYVQNCMYIVRTMNKIKTAGWIQFTTCRYLLFYKSTRNCLTLLPFLQPPQPCRVYPHLNHLGHIPPGARQGHVFSRKKDIRLCRLHSVTTPTSFAD